VEERGGKNPLVGKKKKANKTRGKNEDSREGEGRVRVGRREPLGDKHRRKKGKKIRIRGGKCTRYGKPGTL